MSDLTDEQTSFAGVAMTRGEYASLQARLSVHPPVVYGQMVSGFSNADLRRECRAILASAKAGEEHDDLPIRDKLAILNSLAADRFWHPRDQPRRGATRRQRRRGPTRPLTARMIEAEALAARGLRQFEIADQMGVSRSRARQLLDQAARRRLKLSTHLDKES